MFRCLVDGIPQYVDISQLYGGRDFQVMINGRFNHDITLRGDAWVILPNNSSWLTTDELTIFMDHFDAEIVFEEEI
ncbi:MAG: hypothetical protein LBF27_25755 [Sphingobacterium sp.]|jgi:hypothetical protein|nr:hypothetical protein [Sphingobacterium sp.]